MKPEQVAEARLKHKQEVKAAKEAEEAAKKSAEGVIELTRQNFEREVLRAQVPVVVDCWAAWCGPCKQFSPIFEATAKQYVGVVKFAKLDTDKEQTLARGLGVQALPTVLMFYRGQMVNVAEGALPASQFQAWIYQTLAAVRQYEAQLRAESEDAIAAATQNLAALDGGLDTPAEQPSSSDVSARDDSQNTQARPADRPGSTTKPEPPGKRTSSGLYIP
jgi:thioredoxin